jgi:hypothetical protein
VDIPQAYQHYGKGQGLHVLANGKEIAKSAKIERVTGPLQIPTV